MCLEEASNADEIHSFMEKLHSFLIQRGQLDNVKAKPEQIAFFEERFLHYSAEDDDEFSSTKLGILAGIFNKYFKDRVPHPDGVDSDKLDYIVEALALEPCDMTIVHSFKIKDLWKLVDTTRNFRTTQSCSKEIKWLEKAFTLDNFLNKVFMKISYFGEFLFYCASNTHLLSPFEAVWNNLTKEEKELIVEVKKTIKPELGIAIQIICSNWMAEKYQKNASDMKLSINPFNTKICGVDIVQLDYEAYCRDLEEIKKHKFLKEYFEKFILFLGSEASSAYCYFDQSELEYQLEFFRKSGNIVQRFERILKLTDNNKFLVVRLLPFFASVLIFLLKKNKNEVDFKDLPDYFRNLHEKWNLNTTVPKYMLETKYLLDFVFVDQFKNDFSKEFYELSSNVTAIAVERYKIHLDVEDLKKNCSLPFCCVKVKK